MAKKKLLNKDNPMVIPYGRAVRVGNFKLWRGNYVTSSGKERVSVECVHVSSLDGAWMVRVPSTSQMFGFICTQYATFDPNIRENMLGMVITNMYNVCLTPSPALHDGFWFLSEMLTFPYMLLSEKEMEKRMKGNMKKLGFDKSKAKEHVSKMIEYRRGLYELIERKKADCIAEYERQQAERWAAEEKAQEALHNEEFAEQAIDILKENEEK
jgi:hypothetical protein